MGDEKRSATDWLPAAVAVGEGYRQRHCHPEANRWGSL